MEWLILILTLPTENATARMRAWRALKACGAVVLRDGVYLLPRLPGADNLIAIAQDIRDNGGSAHLLHTQPNAEQAGEFEALFDRSQEYGELMKEIAQIHSGLATDTALDALKQIRKARKKFGQIAAVDFFPTPAQQQVDTALQSLETAVNRVLSPGEPHAAVGEVERLLIHDYQGRLWATRRRPWVDRLACAWLIRRFIDRDAAFVWLDTPSDCPKDALGFDFDGARFSHVAAKVTFEVLIDSFGIGNSALGRIAALVHYLDVGGIQPSEAAGIEQVLAGLRQGIEDDDGLVAAAAYIFDGLFASFSKESAHD